MPRPCLESAPETGGETVWSQEIADAEFSAIYRAHHKYVSACVRHLGVSGAEIADVVQETFLVAYRKEQERKNLRAPRSWLAAIARFQVARWRRTQARSTRKRSAYAADTDTRSTSTTEADAHVCRLLARRYISELEPDAVELLVLTEIYELTSVELAELQGTPASTIRSRIRLARLNLRSLATGLDSAMASSGESALLRIAHSDDTRQASDATMHRSLIAFWPLTAVLAPAALESPGNHDSQLSIVDGASAQAGTPRSSVRQLFALATTLIAGFAIGSLYLSIDESAEYVAPPALDPVAPGVASATVPGNWTTFLPASPPSPAASRRQGEAVNAAKPRPGQLAAENRLISRALLSERAGRLETARRWLVRHQRRFPAGQHRATRVAALKRLACSPGFDARGQCGSATRR